MVDQHSGPEIRSHTVPTVIREIYRQGATGQLLLHRDTTTKNLFFEKGRVVFASSNDRDDRLDQAILNRGVLSLPHLMRALDESLKTQQRLGTVLLARNWIGRAELEKVLAEQLKEIVFSLFAWTDGRLDFRESTEGISEKVTIQDHPLDLVLEGIRRVRSWARV